MSVHIETEADSRQSGGVLFVTGTAALDALVRLPFPPIGSHVPK